MAKVTHSTPLLFVAEIERSIAFYELLGFRLIDDDGCQPLGWARLHCAGGEVMFVRAETPADRSHSGFLFYLYTADLASLREELLAAGVAVSEIKTPPYMPSGMVSLNDPDGYLLEIGHWGKDEQAKWEEHLRKRLEEQS